MVTERCVRVVIQGVILAGLLCPVGVGSARAETTLFENLGTWRHDMTTTSDLAQKYFDQGLRLVYAFNHEEAMAAFTEASRLDPDAPMPYWGLALSLGPNINAAMDSKAESRAVEAVQKATARLAHAAPRERAYVEALAARYSVKKSTSRKSKDEAYAKAMRRLAHEYPEDTDATVLLAEALMVLRPWDYWRSDGRPQPGTEDIVSTLEAALQHHPDHPGACHYYIHAVEASPEPQRGLPCAMRLPSLMPGAGHLVHMPAHIYMRVGRYRDASERNASAATIDHEYLLRHPLEGNYASGYYAHNLHFLNASLVMEGRSAEAMQAARELLGKISVGEIVKEPSLEWYAPTVLFTMARFGQWGELIRQPPPPKELRYTTAVWHYARGLAFAATTRFGSAEGELSNLRKSLKGLARAKTAEAKISRTLLKIAERVLAGEIAARKGEFDAGIQALREALQLEATVPYSEPPFWFQPVRHNLGAVLLLAGRAGDAESVYREDLRLNPENGWALHGLVHSLQAQRKDAAQETARLHTAWAQADVTLTGSRF